MFSTRLLARSATRQIVTAARVQTRVSPVRVAAPAWRPSASSVFRSSAAFSTTRPRLEGSAEELAAKLDAEITYERDALKEADADPSSALTEYLQSSEFQLDDPSGSEEVYLVRQYGDESIKVTFSTESLSNPEADAEGVDSALYDEDGEPKTKQAPEDEIENDEEYSAAEAANFHIAVNVQVSRQGKGAVVLSCYLDQDARFLIENVAYYNSVEVAEGKTANDEYSKRALYTGPPFDELDEGLQTIFEEYLRERGINEYMAQFIPQYIDQKETQEYIKWMENIKSFVS